MQYRKFVSNRGINNKSKGKELEQKYSWDILYSVNKQNAVYS